MVAGMVVFLPMHTFTQTSYDLVYDIFQQKCVNCHNAVDLRGELDLNGEGSSITSKKASVYNQIVRGHPHNSYAANQGYAIIYPGRADQSFLFRKINDDLDPAIQLHPMAGDPMPLSDGVTLSDVEKETIRQWILFGATRDNPKFDMTVIEDYYKEGGQEAFPEGPPPAPNPEEGFQIKIGPFFLEPVGEEEYFWKYETGLERDTEINRIDMDISTYSHHLIIYNFENQSEDLVKDGLRPDQNHFDIGIVAGVQQSEDLMLPPNTAFKWDKQFVLDINTHVINYTTNPLKAEGYVNIYTQPAGTAAQEMHALLVPNPDFFIPNDGEEVTAEQTLRIPFTKVWVWGMLGHTHKYGTSYKVWTLDSRQQKDELIYNASCPGGLPECANPFFDYQHLPTRFFDPLMQIDLNKGVTHEAKWINNGPTSVGWGPTSDDEMMVLGVFFTLDTTGTSTALKTVQESQVTIYPNPVGNQAKLSVPPGEHINNFNLFMLNGQNVQSPNVLNGSNVLLYTAALPSGIYVYQVQCVSGKQFTGKLIKP